MKTGSLLNTLVHSALHRYDVTIYHDSIKSDIFVSVLYAIYECDVRVLNSEVDTFLVFDETKSIEIFTKGGKKR